MREVTLFWRRQRLVKSDISDLLDILVYAEFMGYIERTPQKIRTVVRVVFCEGKSIEDLDFPKILKVEEVLIEPIGDETEWLLLIELTHQLPRLNARTGRTHTVPGSRLDHEGLHYTNRGSPLALKILVAGARMMFRPDRISARNLDPKEAMRTGILSPQQLRIAKAAFDAGWYDLPKRTTMTELAEELGMARSTVSEHLARIESILMHDIFGSFAVPVLTDEQESLLRESIYAGRSPTDEIQVELDRILLQAVVDDED